MLSRKNKLKALRKKTAAPVAPSIKFLAPAPAIQNCLGSGSTVLASGVVAVGCIMQAVVILRAYNGADMTYYKDKHAEHSCMC